MKKEKIIQWIKLNKNKILLVSLVIIVLIAAFWYGGDSKDSHGFKIDKTSDQGDKSNNHIISVSTEGENKKSTEKDSNSIESETTSSYLGEDETTSSKTENNISTENNPTTVNNTEQQNENNITVNKQEGTVPTIDINSSETSKKSDAVEQTNVIKKECTISISCATILDNMDSLDKNKKDIIPPDGSILKETKVEIDKDDSVFDILSKVCKSKKIHMEYSDTPLYDSAYIEGIYNLYEFDCGSLSGWVFSVNGQYYNYGSSKIKVSDGDKIEWKYTCDLGNDVKK